jgi:hypothetical protein
MMKDNWTIACLLQDSNGNNLTQRTVKGTGKQVTRELSCAVPHTQQLQLFSETNE